MDKKRAIGKPESLPIEEKIKLLSETDIAYIEGFVDRALMEQQRPKAATQAKEKQGENS